MSLKNLVLVILAGLTPIAVLGIIGAGADLGLVRWQSPEMWSIKFGTPSSGRNTSINGLEVISGDSTGLYSGGFVGLSGHPSYNVTPSNLFVSRYDFKGRQVWIQTFGTAVIDSGLTGIGVRSDGVYATAMEKDGSYVRKYDLDGTPLWTVKLGTMIVGVSISVGAAGEFLVYHQLEGDLNRGFLRAYDSKGNAMWTQPLGNHTARMDLYAHSNGVYVLETELVVDSTGHFVGTYSTTIRDYKLDGTVGWNVTCSCTTFGDDGGIQYGVPTGISGILGDSTGIYVLGSAQNGGTSGRFDAFFGRYDLNGNRRWTIQIGAPDPSIPINGHFSADQSGVYVAMRTGWGNTFLIKYDSNGNQLWSFQLGAGALDYVVSDVYAIGNSVFVGGTNGVSGFLTEFGQSSSLIFFWLNPPLSFVAVASLGATATISIFLLKRVRQRTK